MATTPMPGEMDADRFNAAIKNNPRLQQWIAYMRNRMAALSPDEREQSRGIGWQSAFADAGLPTELPHDYEFNLGTGQLERQGVFERNPWLSGALAAAGPATAGLAGPALAGASAGAGGGGGAAGAGTAATAGGAGVAAGTGGAVTGGSVLASLSPYIEAGTTAASLLGRLGEGQAGERGAQNAANENADRARASMYGTQQSAASRAKEDEEAGKVTRAQLGITAPSARTRQSILGSLLQNVQDVSFGDTGRVHVPTVSGGLRPSALNAAARASGGELQRQAIDALLSKSDIPESTDFSGALLPPPTATPYTQPGTGESVLSGIGAAGNITEAILKSLRRQTPTSGRTPQSNFTENPDLGYMGG